MIGTNRVKIRLTGTRPLLMARGEAANPFDAAKPDIDAISQKRHKSLEDHERLSRLQFESSMYFDEKIGPVMPCDNLWKCMQQGAAKYRETAQVKSQVVIIGLVGKEEDPAASKLIYDGPRDVDGLYKGGFLYRRMGKIPSTKTSVLVSRARFDKWALEFLVEYVDIEKSRILDYWDRAGALVGLGAWRLRYGLFVAEVIK
jgi:hypothetical protein